MTNISSYFEQAELALAAYSGLTKGMSGAPYTNALMDDNQGMTQAQADDFAKTWRVVDQYNDPLTGLSATIFQHIKGGQTCLAIRGAEGPTDVIAHDFIPKGAPSTLDSAVHKVVCKEAA